MKFGALLVIGADGQERRYEIDVPSLLVGRGAGSGILLDDPSVGERHARLLVESGTVLLEDLGAEGGTAVAGRRLEPFTRNRIGPGQQLQFGALSARYLEPAPFELGGVLPPTGQHFPGSPEQSVLPLSRILLSLILPRGAVRAGDALTGSLRVENRGRVVDRVRLGLSGVPPAWLRGWRSELSLVPGAVTTLPVTIQPPLAPEATAGGHSVVVTATSGVDGRETVEVGELRILPFERVTVELQPLRSTGRFELVVANAGNLPLNLRVDAAGQEDGLKVELETPALGLAPGEERRVKIRAQSQDRRFFGRESVALFTVSATPRDSAAARVECFGQLEIRPPLQPWKLPLQLLFALAVAGAVFGVFWFDWPVRADTRDFPIPAIPLINEQAAPTAPAPSPVRPAPTALAGPKKDDAAAILAKAEERYNGVHLCGTPKSPAATKTPAPTSASPFFRQTDPRWADDLYAAAGLAGPKSTCGKTLAQCGCEVTSMATVLALLQLVTMPDGQPLSPKTLNQWFQAEAAQDSSGWTSRGYSYGDVVWTTANALSAAVAKSRPGTQRIRFLGAGSGAIDEIRPALEAKIPVILEVPGHYIAATAIDSSGKVTISDPYYPDRTTLDFYNGKILGSVLFEPADDLSAITITVASEMRVRVTDAQGRVTGTLEGATPAEAERAAKRDIPGSSYTFKDAWRDPNCIESAPPMGAGTHQIFLPRPAGAYKVEIINAKGGGTSGAVHIYDRDGNLRIQREEGTGNRTFTVQAG